MHSLSVGCEHERRTCFGCFVYCRSYTEFGSMYFDVSFLNSNPLPNSFTILISSSKIVGRLVGRSIGRSLFRSTVTMHKCSLELICIGSSTFTIGLFAEISLMLA